MQRDLPEIHKDRPIPPYKFRDRRRDKRDQAPCKWIAFLKGLSPGDSFDSPYPEALTVRSWARRLGVNLVWVTLNERAFTGMAMDRFWCVPENYGKSIEVPAGPQTPNSD